MSRKVRASVRWSGMALMAFMLAWAVGARADDEGLPGRAVRLSSVDGSVQIKQGGQTLTEHAVANTPLFEGMQVITGDDGRAELQFEDGSIARITPDSSMTLSVLRPDGDTELQLNGGLGYFELRGGDQGQPVRVRFGNAIVSGNGETVLRVDFDQPPGELAVFDGNAHLDGAEGVLSTDLHGGESVRLNAADPANPEVADSIEPDSWDAWNTDRDQAIATTEAQGNPAAEGLPQQNNPAWGDLNANGTWYNVPDQGNVWSPYEAENSDWDPYGSGYWMPTPSYGYLWVSGEPWGYMPYQCGTWNYYDAFGWGWAPGGCNAGWGGGGGWGIIHVGRAPLWYQKPLRPGRPFIPLNPRPGRPHPFSHPPMIAVNRHMDGEHHPLPPREPNAPVTIGGTVVQPIAPGAGRFGYTHVEVPRIHPLVPHDTSHLQVQKIQPLIPQDNSHVQVQRIQPLIPHNTFTSRPGYVRPPEMQQPGTWMGVRPGQTPGQWTGPNAVRPVPVQPRVEPRIVEPRGGNWGARPAAPPPAPRAAPTIRSAPAPAPRSAPAPSPRSAPAPSGHK